MSNEIAYMSAHELILEISSGQLSPSEVVQASIERMELLEPKINAFVTSTAEMAMMAAKACEAAMAKGQDMPPLAGLPLSVKDLIDVEGVPTTCGSRILVDNIASADAPSVERVKAMGGCIVGKTTTTEFGAKAGGGNSPLTGVTRNAWNLSKTTGGSSAGAATSVAAGVTPFAIATDGGGSSRIPPSFCGVFGIKPQFGRVPIYPTGATPSLSHIGVISRSVRDAALLLQNISGYDARDPHSIYAPVPDMVSACSNSIQGLKVAWSPTLGYGRLNHEVRDITEKAALSFEDLGCSIDIVDQVFEKDPLGMFRAEFYAGAGVKMKDILERSADQLDPLVVKSLEPALKQSLAEYYTHVFGRYRLRDNLRIFFEKYDVLLTPTVATQAFDAGLESPPEFPDLDPLSWVFYTYPFNLSGNPAATIPCGFTSSGLPVGLQIISAPYAESTLFAMASAYEADTGWHKMRPQISRSTKADD